MDRNWTYLMFAVGAILLGFMLTKSGLWAWDYLSTSDFAGDYVGKPQELIIDLVGFGVAGVAAVVALRNERLVDLANEVTAELRKVTWPTREETFAATIVVIVTVIVASIFLGLFDLLWSWVARAIYG